MDGELPGYMVVSATMSPAARGWILFYLGAAFVVIMLVVQSLIRDME